MSFRARFTQRCARCGRIVSSRAWIRSGCCDHCREPVSNEFLPRR